MRAIGVICFLLLSKIVVIAQHTLPIQQDTLFEKDQFKHEIIISGVAEYASNSIENDLMKKLLYGGQITNGIKNKSFGHHGSVNRIGADVTGELEYRNYHFNSFKKEKLGFLIKAGYYNYASLIYNKDLFGLAFYGNEQYLGQTANISGTRFVGMSFQKAGFGFFNKQSKNSVSLNFYSVSNYADGNIYIGELFQSQSGDSVSLGLTGNVDYTSTRSFVKGYGAGIDLDFRLPVKINEFRTSIIRFEAKNLGVFLFNKPLTRYEADTIVHFGGFTLSQLFSNNQNSTQKLNVLDSLGVDSVGVRKWRFIPAYFQVGKVVSENDPANVQVFYGIRMYGLAAFAPLIYGGLHYKIARFADLGLSAIVGGFGGLRYGLYSNWKFGNFILGLGTENLTGMFQRNARGESISIRLRCLL
jgi:hypothetical protein